MPYVISDECLSCGSCAAQCPADAISMGELHYEIDPDACRGCRACMRLGCPSISMREGRATVDSTLCTGCGVCAQLCRFGAIKRA